MLIKREEMIIFLENNKATQKIKDAFEEDYCEKEISKESIKEYLLKNKEIDCLVDVIESIIDDIIGHTYFESMGAKGLRELYVGGDLQLDAIAYSDGVYAEDLLEVAFDYLETRNV